MIVWTRVDNRLIHGQIVQGWLPSLDVSEVLIVSPGAVKKEFVRKMLRLALPGGYKLTVLGPKEAKKYSEDSQEKLFIIIEDIANLLHLRGNTVAVRLNRIREQLKKYLEKEGFFV